ncbi:hypothetical protein ACET3Z_017701 [Daucus carota]
MDLEVTRGKILFTLFKLVDNSDAYYGAIANVNSLFTFQTNKDVPRYKLVRVDLKEPSTWTDVLDEAEKDVLESAIVVNKNQIIVSYMSEIKDVLQLRDLKTGTFLHKLLIDIGTVVDISARPEDTIVFISFISLLSPGIIYQCNLESCVPDLKIFREIIVPAFDRAEFHVNQSYGKFILGFFLESTIFFIQVDALLSLKTANYKVYLIEAIGFFRMSYEGSELENGIIKFWDLLLSSTVWRHYQDLIETMFSQLSSAKILSLDLVTIQMYQAESRRYRIDKCGANVTKDDE